MRGIKFNRRFRDMFIMLTEFCPNRCEYCYIVNRHKRETMPMEYIDKLINSFEYETPRIIFFGGEPLVELELMKQVIEKYKDRCTFQVVTSATTNYDRVLTEICSTGAIKELQLSWDGPGNTNRPDVNGIYHNDEVYERIIKTIESGQMVDIKCVIGDHNVDSVYRTYKAFNNLRVKYPGLVHGDFCVAHQETMHPDFAKHLLVQLSLCLEHIENTLLVDKDAYIPRDWLTKMYSILIKDENISSCDAGNYVVMRPTGDLYPCTIFSQRDDHPFSIGHINDKQLNDEVFDVIKRKCTHSDCVACDIKHMCDGGCRFERIANHKEEWQNNYCQHQCDNIKTIERVMSKWMDRMRPKAKEGLMEIIFRYQSWAKNYSMPR